MIIMISRTDILQEYLLPQSDGLDHMIHMEKEKYKLKKDVSILMEKTGGKWFIKRSDDYTFFAENDTTRIGITGGDVLDLKTADGESFRFIVIDSETRFGIYKKYIISDQPIITIGAGEDCNVKYKFMNYVSKAHGRIISTSRERILEDVSANGIFVNGYRIKKSHKLVFGDMINVFGLQIVYLEDIIAIGTHYGKAEVKNITEASKGVLRSEQPTRKKDHTDDKLFHRSPRNIPIIYNDTVKIEPPPEPKFAKKKPLLTLIGPSFTMAIPMLLGCSLAIYSSKMNGSGSGAFMYTGLITAIGSALFGSIWAILNIRNERKDEIENEDHRINAYGNYLIEISEKLSEKYAHNLDALLSMYPSAGENCKLDESNPLMWNRNVSHEDFLYYRLGLGNIPFQVKLEIPEQKFSLNTDFLKDKPKLMEEDYTRLENVPICIDLGKKRLVGVIGGNNCRGSVEIMNNIVAGIAANNCYTDVKMVFLYDKQKVYDEHQWDMFKWLPHVWSENRKTRYIASDANEIRDILYELANIIRRREENSTTGQKNSVCKPHYVLFASEPGLIDNQLIAKYVYHPKPEYGLSTIILAEKYEDLPNECEFIIENTPEFKGMYHTMDNSVDKVHINFDRTEPSELESFAKRITELRVSEFENDSEMPSKLDFLEMYGVSSLEELHVLEQWYKNRTYNSMRALIGKKSGGANCYLDIHEKFHGPHGLVAGTTGSGKSETLQTYILSLAVNFSPEDIAFFIIDFKGGGMANLFTDLPHMAGQISNLSGNQVRRAMISIKSENRRRQRIFGEYGVNNINLYTRLYKSHEARIPIPHLIIIIDEFAELKREEPDFMRELISVAQVGRSLGVHLILATQKPSGTVDDNIRSNSKFHLCLRVQERQDSIDMLHKPDAAYITQAGRCYFQVGNDEIYELFQSGWSGEIYDKNELENKSGFVTMLTLTGKPAIVGNRTKMKRKENERIEWYNNVIGTVKEIVDADKTGKSIAQMDQSERADVAAAACVRLSQRYDYGTSEADKVAMRNFVDVLSSDENVDGKAILKKYQSEGIGKKLPELKEKTQLEVVVKYLKTLAESNGFQNESKLWLPLLPTELYLDQLADISDNNSKNEQFELNTLIGLYDDPDNQLQQPVAVDFESGGHLAVCGTIVSGKSTFIQTMIYGLALKYTPEELNFYILDFSSRMLSCFEKLPHVGGVMYENDQDKISKFFTMMNRIMNERQKAFGGGNYSQYVKAYGKKYPAVIVVLDNYSNFREKTENAYDTMMLRIAREGVGYGIYLAITSAGFGLNEIPNRMADNIRNVICLEMGDKYKYMETMRVQHISVIPETAVKGRGLVKIGDNVLEFQTALSVNASDDYDRSEKLTEWAKGIKSSWRGRCAAYVPSIPDKPVYSDLAAVDEYDSLIASKMYIPIGYRQTDASVSCIDLSHTFCYFVTGRSHCGKTNALRVIMSGAAQKNGKMFVIEKGKSELKKFSGSLGADYISSAAELFGMLCQLKEIFVERNKLKHSLMDDGRSDNEIYQRMSEETPYFIFISPFEEFLSMVYDPPKGVDQMKGFVENIFNKGQLHNIYFFAEIKQDNYSELILRDAYKYFISGETGIHFGGNLDKQRIINVSGIPFTEQSKSMPKGMAVIPEEEGQVYKVIVPLHGGEGQ